MLNATSSQTIGPYWHLLLDDSWADLTRFGASGEVIIIEGHIFDGAGKPFTDACVEIWQATPAVTEHFTGFGRAATDDAGLFRFRTIKPQAIPGPGNTLQAPHVAITILARGLLTHLNTRLYFAGEPENETDPILALIVDPARRGALMAANTNPAGTKPAVWHLDIHLQGAAETVFFAL